MRGRSWGTQLPRDNGPEILGLARGMACEESPRRKERVIGFDPHRDHQMSRIEAEARSVLLKRRESLYRGPAEAVRADPASSWRDWEAQPEPIAELTRRELADVEAALRRIEEGSYGRCESCGGPMGLQRIRAIPEARYCMGCSGQREMVE
jgi:DnaK suppressor protein